MVDWVGVSSNIRDGPALIVRRMVRAIFDTQLTITFLVRRTSLLHRKIWRRRAVSKECPPPYSESFHRSSSVTKLSVLITLDDQLQLVETHCYPALSHWLIDSFGMTIWELVRFRIRLKLIDIYPQQTLGIDFGEGRSFIMFGSGYWKRGNLWILRSEWPQYPQSGILGSEGWGSFVLSR